MSNHTAQYARRARFQAARASIRHKNRRQRSPAVQFGLNDVPALAPIIDHENLMRAYERMRATGGPAAGLDGLRFDNVSTTEIGEILRGVATKLVDGTFTPGEVKPVQVPKSNGGHRTLSIRSLADRIVSAALAWAITRYIDSAFLGCSWGFRPRRSVAGMLAQMETAIVRDNQWVITADDVRGAFDYVPIAAAMQNLSLHIADPGILGLAEIILRGAEGANRLTGIDQGDPLSPLIMNTFLDHHLDGPFLAACPEVTFLRYVDDLTFVTQDEAEGHRALQQARHLLHEAGFQLRSDPQQTADGRTAAGTRVDPVDLRRENTQIELLGFLISRRDDTGLSYSLGEKAWTSLDQQLTLAYEAPCPTRMAWDVARGWLQAYGPALDGATAQVVVERIRNVLSGNGFREGFVTDRLLGIAQDAYGRWRGGLRAALVASMRNGVHGRWRGGLRAALDATRRDGLSSPRQDLEFISPSLSDAALRAPMTAGSLSCQPVASCRRDPVPAAGGTTP